MRARTIGVLLLGTCVSVGRCLALFGGEDRWINYTRGIEYGKGLVHCPRGVENDFEKTCNVKALLLDVMSPAGAEGPGRPAIILVHGGGNSHGLKSDSLSKHQAEYFARRGVTVFVINYRIESEYGTYPGVDFKVGLSLWSSAYPAVRDVKAAVRFVRAHAADFGVDPDHIIILGASAGAMNAIAAGIGFEEDFKEELSLREDPTLKTTNLAQSSYVRALVLFWGTSWALQAVEKWDQAPNISKTRFSPSNPPFVWFHGDRDWYTPVGNAFVISHGYTTNGVPHQVYVLRGCEHRPWHFGCGSCESTDRLPCDRMEHIALQFLRNQVADPPIKVLDETEWFEYDHSWKGEAPPLRVEMEDVRDRVLLEKQAFKKLHEGEPPPNRARDSADTF